MRSSTLASDPADPRGVASRVDPAKVASAWERWVVPCGSEPINRLETLLERKFAEGQQLGRLPDAEFGARWTVFLDAIVSTRPYRPAIVEATDARRIRSLVEKVRAGGFSARDLPALADELSGAPRDVRIDVAAELLHAAAPDRSGLLTRWVWNPERGTGILAEFVAPGPTRFPEVQARLGEIRLELAALGFPSATFASVDILLALAYSVRLSEATDRSFQGGGMESLLPGTLGLASMVLGVRRWIVRADS